MVATHRDFSMLTGQTGLPPNQPTSLKVKNMHNSKHFQPPIWLKLGIKSLNGRTQHMSVIHDDFSMLNAQTGQYVVPLTLKCLNIHC